MKRSFGLTVADSDDDDVEPCAKRSEHPASWRAETPLLHHDVHPSGLSPFRADAVERVEGMPVKTADEEDISVKQYFSRFVDRTEEQCFAESCAPQRSLEWKEARKFALTGSDFGSAAGSNPFCTPQQLVSKKLWDVFSGNDATKWGSHCEPLAGEAFLSWAQAELDPEAKLHSFGLLKWSKTPWLAVSPDGVLEWTENGVRRFDLVEFKCPTRISTEGHPYGKYNQDTPPYYLDQMLGIWGLANENGGIRIDDEPRELGASWFVVWQPTTLWVTKHSFSKEEWQGLRLKLRKWFFGSFLPALVWRFNGLLEHGDTAPTSAPLDLRGPATVHMAPTSASLDLGPATVDMAPTSVSLCGSATVDMAPESKSVDDPHGATSGAEVHGGEHVVRRSVGGGVAALLVDDA